MARVRWSGDRLIVQNTHLYADQIRAAVRMIAAFFQVHFETYAKTYAPWTDRTGNARQSLHSFVEEVSRDVVDLYISHGMEYGIQLETRFAGRYAILWPTVQKHLPEIKGMLERVFS